MPHQRCRGYVPSALVCDGASVRDLGMRERERLSACVVTWPHRLRSHVLPAASSGSTHGTGTEPLGRQKLWPGNSPSHLPRWVTETHSIHLLNLAGRQAWVWPVCRPGGFRGTNLPPLPRARSLSKRHRHVCCMRPGGAADGAHLKGGGMEPQRGQPEAGLYPGGPTPSPGTPRFSDPKIPRPWHHI